MKAQMMKPENLIPYDNNPRKNDGAIEAVADSIDRFGFLRPIVVNADMVILSGHTRRLAALRLGLEEVPVIVERNLTPDEEKAYRLADNRTGEFAKWDYEALEIELAHIDGEVPGLDLDLYGLEPMGIEPGGGFEGLGTDLELGLDIYDDDEDDNDFLTHKREFFNFKLWPTEEERTQLEACRIWYKKHYPGLRMEEALVEIMREEMDE